MTTEKIGDLENEQGFIQAEIEVHEEELVTLRADLIKVESDLRQAKVEVYNE